MSDQISKPTATTYVKVFKVILFIDINPRFICEAGKANCTALRYIVLQLLLCTSRGLISYYWAVEIAIQNG